MCATDVTTHMKTKKKRARFYSIKVLRNSHFLIICLAWFHIVRWTKHTKFSCPDWPQCNDFEWNHRKKYIIGQKKMIEFSLPKIDLLAPVLRHWRDVQYIVLCIQLIRVKLFACTQGIGEEQQQKNDFPASYLSWLSFGNTFHTQRPDTSQWNVDLTDRRQSDAVCWQWLLLIMALAGACSMFWQWMQTIHFYGSHITCNMIVDAFAVFFEPKKSCCRNFPHRFVGVGWGSSVWLLRVLWKARKIFCCVQRIPMRDKCIRHHCTLHSYITLVLATTPRCLCTVLKKDTQKLLVSRW